MASQVIAFRPEAREQVLNGEKRLTVRKEKHGGRGDVFEVHGVSFGDELSGVSKEYEITHIVEVPLYIATAHFYEMAGYDSPGNCLTVLAKLWNPVPEDLGRTVYLHFFTELAE